MYSQLKPIEKQHVTDQVFSRLVGLLLSGQFKPGDRLPSESAIASQLGAGRNSVREAMKVLQVLGVVVRRQGDGSFIAEPEMNRFEPLLIPVASRISNSTDLVELRTVFEVGTADLIIDKATDEELDLIGERMKQLEELYNREESVGLEEAEATDEAFHLALAEVTGNRALIALYGLIMELFRESIKEALRSPKRVQETLTDHRAFFEAIKARDKEAAKQITRQSFERWKQSIHITP